MNAHRPVSSRPWAGFAAVPLAALLAIAVACSNGETSDASNPIAPGVTSSVTPGPSTSSVSTGPVHTASATAGGDDTSGVVASGGASEAGPASNPSSGGEAGDIATTPPAPIEPGGGSGGSGGANSAAGAAAVGGATAGEGGVTSAPLAGAPAVSDAGAAPTVFEGKELFILFGQSNMSGMSPMPEEWIVDENITFMVQYDCERLDQTKDEWLPAQPPLHGCQWATNGIGLGLADYFGVAMAAAWSNSQIGLIPNAIPAVTIDVFMKGGPSPGGGMKALPDGYTSAYTLMVDRAKAAQQVGRVRGILLHQGESDYNQGFGEEWLGKLATVVADLRADLELGEEVPFLAGQIPPGNYDGHNVYVDQVPSEIPNSAVISSEGTRIHDVAHFDAESARIMGERYAESFLEFVPTP